VDAEACAYQPGFGLERVTASLVYATSVTVLAMIGPAETSLIVYGSVELPPSFQKMS